MNKNVEEVVLPIPSFRVPIEGMPPLRGWAVKYVSGMGPDYKPGYWLSRWHINAAEHEVLFTFEAALHMCFNQEPGAVAAAEALRKYDIETEVVKIG